MDNMQILQMGGSFLLGALLAGAATYGWLAGRVKREQQRAQHVEQARQQVALQVAQARKQIEQLQRECHELKLALRPSSVHSTQPIQAVPPQPAASPALAAAEAARLQALALLHGGPDTDDDKREATGFPDTQILRHRGPH